MKTIYPLIWFSLQAIGATATFVTCATSSLAQMAVVKYFSDAPKNKIAVIETSPEMGVVHPGMQLASYRNGWDSRIEPTLTGRLRVIKVGEGRILAKVISEGGKEAAAVFPDYPYVMVTDSIRLVAPKLSLRVKLVPALSLSYFDLFRDPQAAPSNFEISDKGLLELKKIATYFADKHFSKLLIKSYTDHNGAADENQVESLQRASTIKQHLVENYGFDSERIVALGLGEYGPSDQSLTSGYIERNRQIVFKALSDH